MTTQLLKRGDMIDFGAGVTGRYVGTSRAGVEWVLYHPESKPAGTWERMCEAFDELARKASAWRVVEAHQEAPRLYPCRYGHIECSYRPFGPCLDEALHALDSQGEEV